MSLQVRYLVRRILFAVLTVFVLITVTFILMHLLPGTPFSGDKNLKPEIAAALAQKYGLNQPVFNQYLMYMGQILRGDLGSSLISGRQVTDIISKAFPVSFELGVRALVFALVMGVFLGAVSALKKGTAWDTGVMLAALAGVSVPSFILGSLLQYGLGLLLFQKTGIHFFPVMGWGGENSKILPSFALAFTSIAVISRLMRSSMTEVLGQDYIRTAKAKGLNQRQIVVHHCIRNALIPVITVLGPMAAVLFTGTFAIENIFSIPGLGKYFVDSVRSNDYPVIAGTTLFYGSFLVLMNLLVDVIHGLMDRRICQERRG